jgi:hypothetical protein
LSASANKLAKLKSHAATYSSLIMEELDPDDRGYIEVLKKNLHLLLTRHANGHGLLKILSFECRFGSWRRCCAGW